jgi:predicted ATPase
VFPTAEYTFRHALTHDVAYQSLPHEQRRAQHARSAWAIEALLPDTRERQPEVLARHYTLAGQRQPAIDHWHRAAQRALERGAYAEALMHVRSGLELLEQVAETPEGMRQELGLQLALGTVLLRTQGFTFPEVERAFARARALCHQIQDSPELFAVLWGLWQIHMSRGELGPAEKLGAQLLNVAERRPDPVLLLGAHGAVGSSLLFRGELAEAREHFERALVLYMPDSSASHAIILYGHEIGSSTLALLGLTLALQGFQERAGEVGRLALAQGRRVAHPFSLAFALHVVATTCLVTRDAQVAGELGEEELAISREHGFPLFAAGGLWFTAYALVVRGERDRGFELMDEAARAYEAAGAWGPADLPRDCTVAELLIEAGRLEAAMDVIRVALAHSEQGRRWFHAELVRIQGTALLRQEDRDESQAEQCFLEAIELARHQGARTLELRAAISLARLWAQQGKRAAARDELGNVYGGFPEGRDSVDPRRARALLDGLCKARV